MRRVNSLMRSESTIAILSLFLVAFLAVVLRMYNIEYFQVMTSDEAVYAQSSYAISRGYIPYRDVFLAHPPIYFLASSFWMILVGATLFNARSLNVLFGICTMVSIYFMCRKLYSTKVAVIASFFYTVLPFAVFFDRIFIVDNALGLLSILTVFAFLTYNKYGSFRYLLLSGFLAGLSLMTKFTAFQLILFILIALLLKKRFKHIGWFLLAILPIPLFIGALLLTSGILPLFLQDTLYLQFLNRIFSHTLMEKSYFLALYFFWVLPFLSLAVFAMISPKADEDRLITLWYLIPFTLIISGSYVFLQYFICLNAPLSILAALAVSRLQIPLSLRQLAKMRTKFSLDKMLLIFIWLFFVAASLYFTVGTTQGNYENRIAQETKIQSANYIKSVTESIDKIWATDASIAFLAQRIIVTPDSEYYKYQGFFSGSLAYSEDGTYKGPFTTELPTLLHLSQILSAWQEDKPKVIVIVRTSFLDRLILNGIENPNYSEPGLKQYLTSHYRLTKTFNPGGIEVWERIV